jgi:acetyltransferase-like isoleucine patch superfamily enzyme
MRLLEHLIAWIRGMALLRHPELVRELGELRLEVNVLNRLRTACPGSTVERGVVLIGFARARCCLAAQSRVCRGTVLAFGDAVEGYGQIVVGARAWIGQYNNLRASGCGNIKVGDNCLISQFCTLVTAGHGMAPGARIRDQPPVAHGDIVLGDDVWLGAGVTVLPGVTIGGGAVVGANSVVTGSVPAGEIWAGSPARRIGGRS